MPLEKIPTSKMFILEYHEVDKGKYIEKKISILTSNFSVAYAYLLVPKNVEFPAPAIMAMHQHGGTKYGAKEVIGEIGDPSLSYGKELAERGYVVFAMDASSFGGRQDFNNDSFSIKEQRAAQDLFKRGYSPLGIIVQEDLVSLDFLSSLDFVDKENIGCIGHSFGGVRCMYLSALDNRVKATVLSSSVANLKFNYEIGNTHTWLTILPGVASVTETSGILALIAPRPLMIVYTENDPIFVAREAEEQIGVLNGLYNKLEKKENLDIVKIPNKGHEFPLKYHEQAYQFFDNNLKTN